MQVNQSEESPEEQDSLDWWPAFKADNEQNHDEDERSSVHLNDMVSTGRRRWLIESDLLPNNDHPQDKTNTDRVDDLREEAFHPCRRVSIDAEVDIICSSIEREDEMFSSDDRRDNCSVQYHIESLLVDSSQHWSSSCKNKENWSDDIGMECGKKDFDDRHRFSQRKSLNETKERTEILTRPSAKVVETLVPAQIAMRVENEWVLIDSSLVPVDAEQTMMKVKRENAWSSACSSKRVWCRVSGTDGTRGFLSTVELLRKKKTNTWEKAEAKGGHWARTPRKTKRSGLSGNNALDEGRRNDDTRQLILISRTFRSSPRGHESMDILQHLLSSSRAISFLTEDSIHCLVDSPRPASSSTPSPASRLVGDQHRSIAEQRSDRDRRGSFFAKVSPRYWSLLEELKDCAQMSFLLISCSHGMDLIHHTIDVPIERPNFSGQGDGERERKQIDPLDWVSKQEDRSIDLSYRLELRFIEVIQRRHPRPTFFPCAWPERTSRFVHSAWISFHRQELEHLHG
jgi:hypothetical protein